VSSSESSSERDRRAERGEATRAAVVRAARELFSKRGYAAVGTNEIVSRARVTRGAMYHHFPTKKDIFRAVYEETEKELLEEFGRRLAKIDDPWEAVVAGMRHFLDACTDPQLAQIGLIDGPSVLGWAEWREIGQRYLLGVTTFALQNAMDAGVLRRADVKQLAHLMIGSLGEAAMVLANAEDPAATRTDVEATLMVMLEGLRA
jgi:AcrR family transcriptional regulator